MDWLTGALDVISQSLAIPVLVILLILVVVSIVLLGGFIGEFFPGLAVLGAGIYHLKILIL